jgi:uncharacterized membrane protein
MKFVEIAEELTKKQQVIKNTVEHVKFQIRQLEEKQEELENDYSAIADALAAIDCLSANAE